MSLNCWVCNSPHLKQIRNSNYKSNFEVKDFLITDSSYGETASIFRCGECGFLQCPDLENAICYYEELEDHEYIEGEIPRSLPEPLAGSAAVIGGPSRTLELAKRLAD